MRCFKFSTYYDRPLDGTSHITTWASALWKAQFSSRNNTAECTGGFSSCRNSKLGMCFIVVFLDLIVTSRQHQYPRCRHHLHPWSVGLLFHQQVSDIVIVYLFHLTCKDGESKRAVTPPAKLETTKSTLSTANTTAPVRTAPTSTKDIPKATSAPDTTSKVCWGYSVM